MVSKKNQEIFIQNLNYNLKGTHFVSEYSDLKILILILREHHFVSKYLDRRIYSNYQHFYLSDYIHRNDKTIIQSIYHLEFRFCFTLTTMSRNVVIKTINQLLNVVNIFANILKIARAITCEVKNVEDVFICGRK